MSVTMYFYAKINSTTLEMLLTSLSYSFRALTATAKEMQLIATRCVDVNRIPQGETQRASQELSVLIVDVLALTFRR